MKAIQPPPKKESITMQRNWTTAGCRERWVSTRASAGQASALSSSRLHASAPSWRSSMIEAMGIAPNPLPTKRIQPMRRAAPMPSTETSVESVKNGIADPLERSQLPPRPLPGCLR